MIYIDANIFIYAFFNSKGRKLDPKTAWIKSQAKNIIQQINSADQSKTQYCLSVLTLAEIMNTLKSTLSIKEIYQILFSLYSNSAIEIIEVPPLLFLDAIDKMTTYDIDANDITSVLLMDERNITEIFSFDTHFLKFSHITMLPAFPTAFPEEIPVKKSN